MKNESLKTNEQIARLLMKNVDSISDIGLFHGKTGIAIYFYHLARNTGKVKYETLASDVLEQVINSLSPAISIDFANGLTGIGWGIQYLIQNQFVEADSDGIFEEIDNKIHSVLEYKENDFSTLISICHYYISRLTQETEERSILNLKYHTIILIDALERLFKSCQNPQELAYLLDELYTLDIFNYKVTKLRNRLDVTEDYDYLIPQILKTEINQIEEFSARKDLLQHIRLLPKEERWGLKKGIAGIGLQALLKTNTHLPEATPTFEELTIVIPVRIECKERERNLNIVLEKLLEIPKLKIIVLEADSTSKLHLPTGVRRIFIEDSDPIFYRTKYINILSYIVTTPYLGVWDTDVIIPFGQLESALKVLKQGYAKMAFPYDGRFYNVFGELLEDFLTTKNEDILIQNIDRCQLSYADHSCGGAFLVNRKAYIEAGGENEKFYGWGPEDLERYKRWEISGYRVARIKGPMFHMSHPRGINNRFYNEESKTTMLKALIETCKVENPLVR